MSADEHLSKQQFDVAELAPVVGRWAHGHADHYAEIMRNGEWDWEDKEAHPITVLTRRGVPHALYEGNHRVLAAHQAGKRKVPGYAYEIGNAEYRGVGSGMAERIAKANPGGWYTP